MRPAAVRVARFVTVGVVGFVLQIALLQWLVTVAGLHYLLATAVAVELVILHNYAWHARWTWADRPAHERVWARLLRFNAWTAVVSIGGNVALMAVLVGVVGVPLAFANAIAVVVMSALNFLGADRAVFVARVTSAARVPAVVCGAVVLLGSAADARGAELTPETAAAWRRYVAAAEARIDRELRTPGRFLALDFDRPGEAATTRAALRNGTITLRNMAAAHGDGEGVEVPAGTIHHWRGAVFVPGVTVEDVLAAVADPTGRRGHRQEDVIDARVLTRAGNHLRLFLKLQRRLIVSVTYNTEHDVEYRTIAAGRAMSRSVSTRIAELVNAGEPDEYERPVGVDRGFLWALNSYWRYEAVRGGVIVELESLTLSRGIPWGAGAVVRPLVDHVARESLTRTLAALRARFVQDGA